MMIFHYKTDNFKSDQQEKANISPIKSKGISYDTNLTFSLHTFQIK